MDEQQKSGQGIATVRKSHFRQKNMVLSTNLCIGAPVATSGINFVLELGMYNGARGTIIDIVYDNDVGQNNKHKYHLPRYIVVDFPGFKLPVNIKPWDLNHPTVRVVYFYCLYWEMIRYLHHHDWDILTLSILFEIIYIQHVPISMFQMNCQHIPENPCCSVKYCPLVLAWTTIVHKFQGFEAGV